eukprot:3418-Heterococcus_DN1.PRE.4
MLQTKPHQINSDSKNPKDLQQSDKSTRLLMRAVTNKATTLSFATMRLTLSGRHATEGTCS